MCGYQYSDAGPGYCSRSEECTQAAVLPNGGTATSNAWKDTYCNQTPNGWSCECYNGNRNLRVELGLDQVSNDVCLDAKQICDATQADTLTASSCQLSNQSASNGWCSAGFECSRDMQSGDYTVSVYDYSNLDCQETPDGLSCSCNGASTSEDFAVPYGPNAWGTCSNAVDICAEFLSN